MDAQKGKVFTKLIREIMVATREGGGDPSANARLRLLIDKAKAANMPAENVKRAIQKGTGELAGVSFASVIYEGYGPEGIAIMIEVLTDNKNRTVSNLRHIFAKMGGKFAASGSVGWLFERKGVVVIKKDSLQEDEILEKLIDYNIEDIMFDDGEINIQCSIDDLEKVKKGAGVAGFTIESIDVEWVPKDTITVSSPAVQKKAYQLFEALEDHEDVQNVYTNLA